MRAGGWVPLVFTSALCIKEYYISYGPGVGPWFGVMDWIGIVLSEGRTGGALFNLGEARWVRKCVCTGGGLARGGGRGGVTDWWRK